MPATPPLRERIVKQFNDSELTLFCADHFPNIGREFTVGMALSERAQLLIKRCARDGRAAALLDVLEAQRRGLVGNDRDVLLADMAALAAEPEQPAGTTIHTGGGDYTEGNSDKRAGAFLDGATAINSTIIGQQNIKQQVVQQAPPLPSPGRLHQLRAPVADFVGREAELAAIVAALQPAADRTAMAITGLRGMGGIGKSELAFAAAQRLAPVFPDAQIVIPLQGASSAALTAAQALAHVVQSFHPDAPLSTELAALQALYTSCLSGVRALILADDARDAAQVRGLLPPPGCALLITSRTHFSLPGMRAHNLGTLPAVEAEQLLLTICPRIGGHAAELTQLCGFLPLALRVTAGVLANSTRSVPSFLAQLRRMRLEPMTDPDDEQANVERSLQLSYDALVPAAQAALSQLSVFPASFDRAAALAVLDLGDDGDELLDLLKRRSLLEWDEATERFDLHDLVRVFAAVRLLDTDAVRLRHAQHYARVASEAEDNRYLRGDALGGLALFDCERVHIDAGWSWAIAHAGDDHADALLRDYADATATIGELRYDVRRERIPRFNAALEAARRRGHRGAEGTWLGNLGVAYRNLGEVRRAIELYEQVLTITREVGDRRGEGTTLGNLGLAYRNLGEVQRAIELYEQHLAITREVGDRRGEGRALNNLGIAYASLGEVRRAIELYEQRLTIAREVGDRRGEGNSLNNLGIAYASLGEVQRTIELYEQHLAITREIGDRQGEAHSSWNLGLVYERQGDLVRALELLQVRVDYEREIGHPDAQKHAALVDALRQRIADGEGAVSPE